MTRPFWIALFVGIGIAPDAHAQAVVASRAVAIGAYGAVVNDTRGFVSNPAGMVGMKKWELNATTYAGMSGSHTGFIFDGVGLGARFADRHAFALQYAPGVTLDFILPATLTVAGLNIPADRKISFDEPLALAYAFKVSRNFSAGIDARMRREKATDPQYEFQLSDTALVAIPRDFTATGWSFDAGLRWEPSDGLQLSAVGRNLATTWSGAFPEEFQSFTLPSPRALELGVSWSPSDEVRLAASAGTERRGALGIEWTPVQHVALRAGVYGDTRESPSATAVALGAGWTYDTIELEASYLHFTGQASRKGVIGASAFSSDAIADLSMNRYTPDRISLSARLIFGGTREALVKIESAEVLTGIYPAAMQALAYKPIVKVVVRNVSDKPVQATASFFVEQLMDAPTDAPSVRLNPGEMTAILLTAVFNDRIRSVEKTTIRDGNIFVTATPAEQYDDRFQARVLIHGRNDWDGDVLSLRYFVTPDDPAVIRYTRDILLQAKDSLAAIPPGLEPYHKAQLLLSAFAGKLIYINDPKQSGDFVQYPVETLQLRGGDCDDMTVCFASLLSSIGIPTAFVDVVPPGAPEKSHIYLLFDTGLDPRYGPSISSNPKRYVVRMNKQGAGTIWLPIESTVIAHGFDAAWTAGAQEYFDDVEVGLGLAKGWVKVVDVY